MKTVILKKNHVENCSAVKSVESGDWHSPWFMSGKEVFFGDSIGRKTRGFHRWFEFMCNNTGCDAWGIVEQNLIDDMIQNELEKM